MHAPAALSTTPSSDLDQQTCIARLTREQASQYIVALMNTGEENTTTDDTNASAFLSLELELAPAWAKKSPEAHHQRFSGDPRGGEDDHRRPGGDRAFSRPRNDSSRDRRPAPRGPAQDARRDNANRPDRGAPRPADRSAPRPPRNAFHSDLRRPDERREFRPVREEQPPLPLEIRVLPDQKALGAVIRKIQTSHRAYPLRDIARLFLENDAAYQIRIEPAKGESMPLFQCKVCGLPALSEEEIRTHVLTSHLGDFFDVSEIETEPPAGNFVCVARCGLSGELLGPPNHHSFNTRVQEMLRTRYAHMNPETYRARIEMVRDQEAVTQWRESCRKKNVYRRKRPPAPLPTEAVEGAEGAPAASEDTELPLGPAMERTNAELVFQREILPEQVLCVKHMVCPAAAVRKTPSARLLETVRETMNRELRFPASLFFALRGAFRHRSLHLFRANQERGQDFVVVREPAKLDSSHVVADLRLVLEYINEHPGCTRQELLDALSSGDAARGAHLATQLNTLVEKAHVIEFYNSILSPPMEYPIFRYLPGERDGQGGQSKKPAREPRQEGRNTKPENREPTSTTQEPDAQPEAAAVEQTEPAPEAVAPAAEAPEAPAAAEPVAPVATPVAE